MKKLLAKISLALSTFVLNAQTHAFAVNRDQTEIYGPAPDPISPQGQNSFFSITQPAVYGPAPDTVNTTPQNTVVDITQPAVYGPAPDPIRTATGLGHGQILSILVSIILFCIGIAIAVNKGIKKNVKIISLIIISAIIIGLILLTIFVLYIICIKD